ncbi:MAG: redox-sensing transcriptional repressor Rex [Lachnospiraceae bacterium]|nr:redox-sensing transcriptional repressor Rex [Lachnospiraceae bacterium]
MSDRKISIAVIKRLPRYYRYLGELLSNDVVRISSKELSERMGVTASQIRQDLNNFGGFGQQGYGYNVEYLYNEIGKILGLDKKNKVIIIGAGNVGQALANYSDFQKRGFDIIGIFDVNPAIIGTSVRGIEIRSMSVLEQFMKDNKVDIAALTIPKEKAPQVAADLVKWGIRAVWNFAPTDLHLPPTVAQENVHLAESLMRLSCKIKTMDEKMNKEKEKDKK